MFQQKKVGGCEVAVVGIDGTWYHIKLKKKEFWTMVLSLDYRREIVRFFFGVFLVSFVA
jgi:hypothetical protein